MMRGEIPLSTVVKNLNRILGALFVSGQPLTTLEFMSFIKGSCTDLVAISNNTPRHTTKVVCI
jgi:hypothetical protein